MSVRALVGMAALLAAGCDFHKSEKIPPIGPVEGTHGTVPGNTGQGGPRGALPPPPPEDSWTCSTYGDELPPPASVRIAPPPPLPQSVNDDSVPSLLVDGSGNVHAASHRRVQAACSKCTAERLVRVWDGAQWATPVYEKGWPGVGPGFAPLAWDPSRRSLLLADTDLSDPYQPPLGLHVWLVDGGALRRLGDPVASADSLASPAMAVDPRGVVHVAWIEAPRYERDGSPGVRFARFIGTWYREEVPASASNAGSVALQVDARGGIFLAWSNREAVHVARWQAGQWLELPPIARADLSYRTSIALALDARGLPVVAYDQFASGPYFDARTDGVAVQRWDGTAWRPTGSALGYGPPALAATSSGAVVLASGHGLFDVSDKLELLGCGTALRRPVSLFAGDGYVLSAWRHEGTGTQASRLTFAVTAR